MTSRQERRRDKCFHCHRWIAARGFSRHERKCSRYYHATIRRWTSGKTNLHRVRKRYHGRAWFRPRNWRGWS